MFFIPKSHYSPKRRPAPAIFSHANPYGVYPHYRNIKDDQIRACAAAGGVIGVTALRHFLGADGTIAERMLACVRYLSDLVGPEHVGIGLDHVPGDPNARSAALARQRRLHPVPELGQLPREYAPVTVLAELARLLLARQVWKPAGQLLAM